MRKDAITHLEIQDEDHLYRAMSRGELEARELQAQRAYATGPKDVSAELKATALAEADQRQAAAEAEAQGDEATARRLHCLADLLGTRKAALEVGHAEHETWSARTAGLREDGDKAHVELGRRGQATEPRPGETNLEWWRFGRDCQSFEQHLASLEAQAGTDGTPWPPQPVAEHQLPADADRDKEADLDTTWSAEILEEPSCEPEPEAEMPEATAEL